MCTIMYTKYSMRSTGSTVIFFADVSEILAREI